MQEFADLHIHSSHSKATSHSITPSTLLAASAMKGISVLGSGDAFEAGWRSAWSESTENDEGILIVPSAEVEGDDRIHHLILVEDFEGFEELADAFRKSSTDIDTGGRPHVKLSGAEIAARVHALGGLVGPAHAFTLPGPPSSQSPIASATATAASRSTSSSSVSPPIPRTPPGSPICVTCLFSRSPTPTPPRR